MTATAKTARWFGKPDGLVRGYGVLVERGGDAASPEAITLVNPEEIDQLDPETNVYLLSIGVMGDLLLAVWADSVESAVEEAVEYLARHGREHLVSDEELRELMLEVQREDPRATDDELFDAATVDITVTDAGMIGSDEWSILDTTEDDVSEQMAHIIVFGNEIVETDWLERRLANQYPNARLR